MGSYLVLINNIRRSLRHKLLWFVMFIAPVVLSFGVKAINQLQSTTYRIGVFATYDQNLLSNHASEDELQQMIELLNQMDGVSAVKADQESIHTDIIMGTYHYGIDVSKLPLFELLLDSSNVTDLKIKIEQLTQAIVSYSDQEATQNVTEYVLNNLPEVATKENQKSNENISNQSNSDESVSLSLMERSIAFLCTMFMIMSVIHAGMYIRDKREGMIARYCYSPKLKMSYLVGNYLYVFLITLVQISLSFFIISEIQQQFVSIEAFITIVGVLSIVASVFAIGISSIAKSEVQAGISASAIVAIMSLLSGTFVSVSQLPGFLQSISIISPIRWCIELSKLYL